MGVWLLLKDEDVKPKDGEFVNPGFGDISLTVERWKGWTHTYESISKLNTERGRTV